LSSLGNELDRATSNLMGDDVSSLLAVGRLSYAHLINTQNGLSRAILNRLSRISDVSTRDFFHDFHWIILLSPGHRVLEPSWMTGPDYHIQDDDDPPCPNSWGMWVRIV
jgi:hypothetical protein